MKSTRLILLITLITMMAVHSNAAIFGALKKKISDLSTRSLMKKILKWHDKLDIMGHDPILKSNYRKDLFRVMNLCKEAFKRMHLLYPYLITNFPQFTIKKKIGKNKIITVNTIMDTYNKALGFYRTNVIKQKPIPST